MYRAVGDDGLQFTQPLTQRAPTSAPAPAPLNVPKIIEPTKRGSTDAKAEGALLLATGGGCTQLLPTDGQGPCLDANWINLIGSCRAGLPAPAGVSASTWKSFCAKSTSCAWESFPGCSSYDTTVGATVPGCLDDKTQAGIDYCDAHPLADGPDADLNVLCWAASKSPTFMYNAHVAPLCSGASKAGMSPMVKWGLVAGAVVAGVYFFGRRR